MNWNGNGHSNPWLSASNSGLSSWQCSLGGEPSSAGENLLPWCCLSLWESNPDKQVSNESMAVCYFQTSLCLFTELVSGKAWHHYISCWLFMGSVLFWKIMFVFSLLFLSGSMFTVQVELSSGQQTPLYSLSAILKQSNDSHIFSYQHQMLLVIEKPSWISFCLDGWSNKPSPYNKR